MSIMRRSISLFDDDHAYEHEWVDAVMSGNKLCVEGVTSEKGEGGTYGIGNRLDEENTIRLEKLLGTDEDGLLDELARRFCGSDADREFCSFCRMNGIQYGSYVI